MTEIIFLSANMRNYDRHVLIKSQKPNDIRVALMDFAKT